MWDCLLTSECFGHISMFELHKSLSKYGMQIMVSSHILKIFLSKTFLAYILMFKMMSTSRHISLLFLQYVCIKRKRILRKEFHNTLQQHHNEDRGKHRWVNKLFLWKKQFLFLIRACGITKNGQESPVKRAQLWISTTIFPNLGHLECCTPINSVCFWSFW